MLIEEYRKIVLQQNNKNIHKQIQGRINRESGKNFEEQIEIICEIYKLNNLAIIEKTPEPMKIIKHIDNGHFEAVFLKSAQPDFKGTLKGGKTVCFDAKFTESDRITYQALSDFQRDELQKYNQLGAIAFVLVGFSDGNIYKIDINTWANMKEIFGHKHIKQTELNEMNLKSKQLKNGIVDFLGVYKEQSELS